MLIDDCIREGITYENLNMYGVREMELFLKGVYDNKKDTQRQTRRICFTLAKVMGVESINRETDLWVIDEEEVTRDVEPQKIDYFVNKLKELGKWKN